MCYSGSIWENNISVEVQPTESFIEINDECWKFEQQTGEIQRVERKRYKMSDA